MPCVTLLPTAIPDLFAAASETHALTVADRYGLMAALLDDCLSEEERQAIDRLLRGVLRGRIQLSPELSASPSRRSRPARS